MNRFSQLLSTTVNLNKFVRKAWKTKDIFRYNLNILDLGKTFHSIHNKVKFIKSWDKNVSFFINGDMSCPFLSSNFGRLRNIFIKNFSEEKLWLEIEKMFKSGILDMSLNSIYWGDNIYSFSILSRFLLELYLFEFDSFLTKLSFDTEHLCKWYSKKMEGSSLYSSLLLNSVSIKLENNLKSYNSLSTINMIRFNNFLSYFKCYFPRLYSKNFRRSLYWVRHVNFFLLGFVASKNYCYFLFGKLATFVRSCILFDVKNVLFTSSLEKNLFFLGFNIFLVNSLYNESYDDVRLKKISLYEKKVQNRINVYRVKTFNLSAKRFSSELFLHFISFVKKKRVSFGSLIEKKLWIYVFQLECVRALQYGKLVFGNDNVDILNYSFFSCLKSPFVKTSLFYRSYSYNLYVRKLHIVVKDLASCFDSYFFNSIIPSDIVLYKFLNFLNKKIFFFYENLYYNTLNIASASYLNPVSFRSSTSDLSSYKKVWKILAPKYFIFKKLRVWGFIHPYKDRPVSNSKFLMMEDIQIISKFGFVSNKIISWFRCCDNFLSIKFFVEIIRQSCFLTLSRKHNKNKNWAYSVYTPNLLFPKKLYFIKLIFPNRRFVYKLSKKFLIKNSIFFFNEKFFLTDFNID